MNNEQSVAPSENFALLSDTTKATTLRLKLKKALTQLKPTFMNVLLTFIAFLISLVVSKNLTLTLAITLGVYLGIILLIQPLIKNHQMKAFLQNPFQKSFSVPQKLPTKSQTVLLYQHEKSLIAISLLRVKWFERALSLKLLWDYLQEEGISIQDCQEGCFLVIKKQEKIDSMAKLEEEATKLVRELEKVIILTKRKFELSFTNVMLKLVKGQEQIKMILHLGLSPEKFVTPPILPEEDILLVKGDLLAPSTSEEKEEEIND